MACKQRKLQPAELWLWYQYIAIHCNCDNISILKSCDTIICCGAVCWRELLAVLSQLWVMFLTLYVCLWGGLLTSTLGHVVILWAVCSAFDGMSALWNRTYKYMQSISKQHGDVMPSSCHSEKMLRNMVASRDVFALQFLWWEMLRNPSIGL